MGKNLEHIMEGMRANPKGVRFNELVKVCDNHFGKAKAYQVKQALLAIDKLEEMKNA